MLAKQWLNGYNGFNTADYSDYKRQLLDLAKVIGATDYMCGVSQRLFDIVIEKGNDAGYAYFAVINLLLEFWQVDLDNSV